LELNLILYFIWEEKAMEVIRWDRWEFTRGNLFLFQKRKLPARFARSLRPCGRWLGCALIRKDPQALPSSVILGSQLISWG
jgi:hypothetical protein